MGVDVGVRVGGNVAVGEGEAVADGATVGAEGEAVTAVPHALSANVIIPKNDQ